MKTYPSRIITLNLSRISNKLPFQIRAALALAAAFAFIQPAGAATPVWSNANGGDWSVGANWSTAAAPGTADDVQFGDTGAGATTTNNIPSETIDSLTYDQDDSLQQTTVIPSGQTLTLASSVAAGKPIL